MWPNPALPFWCDSALSMVARSNRPWQRMVPLLQTLGLFIAISTAWRMAVSATGSPL